MPDQGEQPRPGRGAEDETRPIPPAGEPGPPSPSNATRPLPPSDATRPLPPSDATRPVPSERTAQQPPAPVWSGRAGVPPPSAPVRRPAPEEWEVVEQPSGRPWWMPILLGILALILFSVIAVGLWLIARSTGDGERTPTPPPATTAAPTTPSVQPTSAAPTSAAATTAAPQVVVPPVVGLPREAAQIALDQVGLPYRLRFRESDRPAGTVIGTDPENGARVPSGTLVTLVIAEAPTAPPTTAESQPTATVTATATPSG